MTNQYVNDKPLHVGSATVKVALYDDVNATIDTAVEIGILDGVSFALTGQDSVVESDNADDIDFGITNQQAEIGASAWKNLDLEVLFTLIGEMGTLTITPAGTSTTVQNEPHKLNGIIATPLKQKNAGTTISAVTNITVKSADGQTTYVEDTDYVVGLTPTGYTTIGRISTGSIADGDSVTVGYQYIGAAAKMMTYGSGIIPKYLHVWLENTNAEGKKFIIEVYKVSSIKSVNITLGSDKSKALFQLPISLVGKVDSTRVAGDDLYHIYDEQGVL